MKIEKANINDHFILSEITIDGKAFWGYSKEQLEIWKDDLTITQNYIENNQVFKIIIDNQIIGYYSILKMDNETSKLDNIFLFQKYIGKGFGKVLMEDCLTRVKDSKAKKLILDSEPNAEKFYAKFGFQTYNLLESSIKNRYLPQMKLEL